MRLLRYGDRAVLAELDDAASVPGLRAGAAELPGVVDAVAGARTVLAVFDPGATTADRLQADLAGLERLDPAEQPARQTVELPVVYDGADLYEVAAEAGLTREEVVRLHAGGDYTVRFCGFSPGFGYLDGLDARLHLPRRAEPRTSVPAGSVAIAGEFTGVYPRATPGGWRLLGTTDAELWDVTRDRPALLAPGTRVRFVAR
jgi:KipI family sensor histidine kinase inhibitor